MMCSLWAVTVVSLVALLAGLCVGLPWGEYREQQRWTAYLERKARERREDVA